MSLLAGSLIVTFSLFFGILIGVTAGYLRCLESLFMRVMDIFMAFPSIMLALALMAIFGRGLFNIVLALGIVYTPRVARIMYGLTLAIRENNYVEAAQAIGIGRWRMFTHYFILNALSPIIVQASFIFAFSILSAASLDFLGVGIPPEFPTWGGIASEGRDYLTRAPWIIAFPGLAIVLVTLSLNLVGDTVRDALDPRLRNVL